MYHHIETTKKQLVGKTLEGISRIDDSTVMIEFGDGSRCKLSVSGNGYSHSIFYEIEMPEHLKGATLKDIEESGWRDESESKLTSDTEEVALEKVKASGIEFWPYDNKIWNVVLITNRGNALIRHINSSNGYYDGSTCYNLHNKLHKNHSK